MPQNILVFLFARIRLDLFKIFRYLNKQKNMPSQKMYNFQLVLLIRGKLELVGVKKYL